MKTPLIAATLLFASVSLFGAAAGGGTVPTFPNPPVTPPVSQPPGPKTHDKKCDDKKTSEKKCDDKKSDEKKKVAPKAPEKKCDDSKRPFKK
jgi:hypothetical protein